MVGAGDDCAVLGPFGEYDVIVGTDYVRGVKFLLFEQGLMSLRDVGRFLVTANASDLAAMGADPVSFLAVVRYPSSMNDQDFREVMRGIDEGCAAYGLNLSGGDTGSAERLIVSGTAVGSCPHGEALLRSRAEPGDVIAVTAPVGAAGAAVAAHSKGLWSTLDEGTQKALLEAWTQCSAQVDAGVALRRTGVRVSAQDVSDGLRATARELAEASSVAAVLDLASVPVGAGVSDAAAALDLHPVALAVSGSTDFCLCFTCAPEDLPVVQEALRAVRTNCWVVGRCELGTGVWAKGEDGRMEMPGSEWRHRPGDLTTLIEEIRR
jgi:thiamine-monophosphate kinase